MCGIFGYVGRRDDAPKIVFEGLKRLEYRGYDSWGIVAIENLKFKIENLVTEKHMGKIGDSTLNPKLLTLNSNFALGHTRWATHGGVTVYNAHPHLDCSGRLALVHNGIVENYLQLRKSLGKKGHKFKSETDTEVVVHLVEEYAKRQSLKEAVRSAFQNITGLNAFVFISDKAQLFAVKSGTPLVIGIGNGENFISSDPSALLPHTKKAIFLADSQLAEVTQDSVDITNAVNKSEIKPKILNLDWKEEEIELGKFKHFMIKEIYEQPGVLRSIAANSQPIVDLAKIIKRAHGTFFIGCGTASYAALSGAYLFSKIAKKHVNFSIGSEFNYLEDYLTRDSLVVAISQSGETIDVVEPAIRAKTKGACVVALTNVIGSSLYRLADYKILLAAGPERAVCATKSFCAMVANLIYLTYAVVGRLRVGKQILEKTANGVEKILKEEYIARLRKLAKKFAKSNDVYIIGRGLSYATALEATLKLKEVPYLHSEGFAGGELKHGVIALIAKGTPCIAFAPLDETRDAIISNAIEVKSRGGYIIGISPQNNEGFDFYLPVADAQEASIIVNTVPIQLLAYYIALEKGLDPDKPRNLAKSVTVK